VRRPTDDAEAELPDLTQQRRFLFLGLLVCASGKKVMIGEGAHADLTDLPAGEAGVLEMVARVGRHYGTMYDDPGATWRLLRVWEHSLAGETLHVLEIGDMDTLNAELADKP